MKAVILCTDDAFKLLPVTYTVPKELIPTANVPVMETIIIKLVEAGIVNIAVVSGESRTKLESYFQDGRNHNCRIRYYNQPKHLESAYGIFCAREFVDDDFILINGNNYFDLELKKYIKEFKANKYSAMLLVKKTENSWEYEIADYKNGEVSRLFERHTVVGNGNIVTGIYFFTTEAYMAASRIKPDNRSEYTLLNTFSHLLKAGYRIGCREAEPFCISIDKLKDILECNKYVLSKNIDKITIGSESRIINCKIDQFTAIGKRCIVKDSQIGNSIIMDDCIINGVEIYDSILCEYSIVAGKGSINGVLPGRTKIYLNNSVYESPASNDE